MSQDNSVIMYSDRKPYQALLFSLVMPGLGQIYNGEATKGVFYFFGLSIVAPVSAVLALYFPVSYMWIVALITLLIAIVAYLFGVRDAYKYAKARVEPYPLQVYNKVYVYVILIIIGHFFLHSAHVKYTRDKLVAAYYIPSNSNLPTLQKGDLIFADMRVNCIGCKTQLKRGDLVIFVNPNNRTQLYIKRIIGLPGDKVIIEKDKIKVNNQSLDVKINSGNTHRHAKKTGYYIKTEISNGLKYQVQWKYMDNRKSYKYTVDNGRALLIGDNRDESTDSRKVGTIPLVDIIGKANQIWFSHLSKNGVMWNRIGKVLSK